MIKPLKKVLDLRSDTVTRMSPSMIEALCPVEKMHSKEKPVLDQLNEKVAQMLGKEKALFAISGTMSNLLAVSSHCKPGETAIIGRYSHINMYEQGGISSIAGVKPSQIDENPDGTLDLSVVSSRILPLNPSFSQTTLIASENSYNYLLGKALPLDYPKRLSDFCKPKNIKTHLDGARLLNSYYYYKEKHPNLEIKDLTKDFDSICMCFSKCLRAPIGSILVGSEEFIFNAMRKMQALGGYQIQEDYVAAACLQSLEEASENIPKDNLNAKLFAEELNSIGISSQSPDTNIVVFSQNSTKSVEEFAQYLKNNGILANPRPDGTMRVVFSAEVDQGDIEYIIKVISQAKNI